MHFVRVDAQALYRREGSWWLWLCHTLDVRAEGQAFKALIFKYTINGHFLPSVTLMNILAQDLLSSSSCQQDSGSEDHYALPMAHHSFGN
jgi:hypothetical protein